MKRKHLYLWGALGLAVGLLATVSITWREGKENARREPVLKETRVAERVATPREAKRKMRPEEIDQAAQRWYERLLEQYPAMRPSYRDIPAEENGFLQFVEFSETLEKKPSVPDDVKAMLRGDAAWNEEQLKIWLAENRGSFDRVLAMAELKDRSVKGVPLDKIYGLKHASDLASSLLLAAAKLEMKTGDPEKALRYAKALSGFSDHLTDIEVPNMLAEVLAAGARRKVQDFFRKEVLAGAEDSSLDAWQDAVFRKEPAASEYRRVMIGEWNVVVRKILLPQLLSDYAFDGHVKIHDVDGFIRSYTGAMQGAAEGVSSLGPERFAVEFTKPHADITGLDPGTADAVEHSLRGLNGIGLGNQLTQSRMDAAAIAVRQGRDLPLDPVSGLPFHWDAETRMLSAPDATEGIDPIHVP